MLPKTIKNLAPVITELATSIWSVYWTLVRIIIPVLILVKILDSFGFTEVLASAFSPLMSLVGLPDILGLVLATAVLTNMYTAMAIFLSLTSGMPPLSVADISVLSSMMLLAHSIPVEGVIARAIGISWWIIICLRVGGAFLLGLMLHIMYETTGSKQMDSIILWQPGSVDTGLVSWGLTQLQTLAGLLVVLTLLMILLKLLKYFGVEKWIHWILAPLLKFLGIGKQASNVVVIGIMLGLSFGGGLLIQEAKNGSIPKRDIFLSMYFLCICHSLIDDTIVVLLLGADIVGVLWIRIVFALVLIAIIARIPLVCRRLGY